MSDERFARALDDGLRALRGGAGLERALGRHAELAPDLAPLLETASLLREAPPVSLSLERRVATRNLLMAAIASERPYAERHRRSGIRWSRFSFVPLMALALVVAVIVFATSRAATPAPPATDGAGFLTVLQGDVQVETPSGLLAVQNGMELRAGDRIVTKAGSRAVLTFFDGSTVTLEPDTVVVIENIHDENGQLKTVLSQPQGSTWTHVPQALGPAQIEIDTPNARVQTNDGSFATTVQEGRGTQVDSQSGGVEVSSGDSRTAVTGGQQATVDTQGGVGPVAALAQPQRELVVQISGSVYAYLTDPGGATVGTLAPGVPVNQVNGATATTQGDTLVLRIPDPLDGAYKLGLRSSGAGVVNVSGLVRNGNDAGDAYSFEVAAGESWMMGLSLSQSEVRLAAAQRTEADLKPELVTVPDKAVEKALTTQTQPAAPTSTPQRPTSTATPSPRPSATPTSPPASTPRPTVAPTQRPKATPVKEVTATPLDRTLDVQPRAPVTDNDVAPNRTKPRR